MPAEKPPHPARESFTPDARASYPEAVGYLLGTYFNSLREHADDRGVYLRFSAPNENLADAVHRHLSRVLPPNSLEKGTLGAGEHRQYWVRVESPALSSFLSSATRNASSVPRAHLDSPQARLGFLRALADNYGKPIAVNRKVVVLLDRLPTREVADFAASVLNENKIDFAAATLTHEVSHEKLSPAVIRISEHDAARFSNLVGFRDSEKQRTLDDALAPPTRVCTSIPRLYFRSH